MRYISFINENKSTFIKILLGIFFALAVVSLVIYNVAGACCRVTPILMYHSISGGDNSLCVTPENFARQMSFLKEKGYTVISMESLVRAVNNGKKFLPRTVVITFDDGFEDNFTRAFPVLAKYDMPATIFLVTGYVDNKEGYLKWDQVIMMKENNIDFGGHTRSNVYLPSVGSRDRLWHEIKGCRDDIKKYAGIDADYFCYPIGGFNDAVKSAAREAGYKGACTTNRGMGSFNEDVFELKRVKVTNSDLTKPFHFRAKLSGFYNLFRSKKSGS